MNEAFYFGNIEAGADNKLLDYFYVTNTATGLIKQTRHAIPFIYASRPGAGKTAISKWIESQSVKVINVTNSGLRLYFEDEEKDFNREDYRLLYTFSLLSGVISEAVKDGLVSKTIKTDYLKYLAANFSNDVYEKFKNEFEGLGVGTVSFSLSRRDRRSFIKDVHRAKSIDKAKQYVQQIAQAHTIKLIIDGPEKITSKGFDELSDENLIRIGCFLSALDVLNECGIGVICFIQEYVLNKTRRVYIEVSQLESKSKVLSWTEKELMSMLNLRITDKLHLQWDNVFCIDKKQFEDIVFPNLINGPRDLLTICNEAGEKGEIISRADLEKQIEKLLRKKWGQIETEYSQIWPNIVPFSKAVLETVGIKYDRKVFSKDQFFRAYQADFETPKTKLNNLRSRTDWVNEKIPPNPEILKSLYVIGFLGYVADNQKKFPWMGISIDEFEEANEIFITPLFLQERISETLPKRQASRSKAGKRRGRHI